MSASRNLRPWASLTPDLLLDVSGRLHDAADFVRFRAVCTSWRELQHSTATPPKFLPWVLTQCNGHITHTPIIYSSSSEATSSYHGGCNGVIVASAAVDQNWVASADGTTAWVFTESPEPSRLVDLVTGTTMPLPRFPDNHIKSLMKNPHGMVYNDGTVFLHTFVNHDQRRYLTYTAAVLRRDDVAWTVIEQYLVAKATQNSCAAYHDGKALVWPDVQLWYVVTLKFDAKDSYLDHGNIEMAISYRDRLEDERYVRERCYVLESRGELLRVSILAKRGLDEPSSELSVLVHALEGAGVQMRWVMRDGKSFADRVLFLGSKASFSADAAQLGMRGGCAYFVYWGRLFRCCLLVDGEAEAEFVMLLCSGGGASGWLQPPQPEISPIQKIREKLEHRSKHENEKQ